MPRSLKEITTHLRLCIADGSIKTTLIQTEDLALLCDIADPQDGLPAAVELALMPHPSWKHQSFEYYAAHFLVGVGLTGGDLIGNMKGLASALRNQYEIGVEHGQSATEAVAINASTRAEQEAST